MQRLKVLGLALMAVFMLGVVASSSASAETLPKFDIETHGTGTFGKSKLNLAGANITSAKGQISSFLFTPGTEKRLGTFDILFEETNILGEPCLSLLDSLGIILVTGTWHLVHLPKEEKHVSLLLLIDEIHIECPGIGLLVLILAGSSILALILPIETLTKHFKLLVNVKEGKQECTEWVDDAGKVHKTELLGALNGGKDKAATQETAEGLLLTEKETLIELK